MPELIKKKLSIAMPIVHFKKTPQFGFLIEVLRKGGKEGAFGRALAENKVGAVDAANALGKFYEGVRKEGSDEMRREFVRREIAAYAKARKA